MIAHKHTAHLAAFLMALATLLCLCAVLFSGSLAAAADGGMTMEYETALFDTDTVLSVNILMDEADWTNMLENAISETYYTCNVEINGKTFYRVGIRPKGNTSLSSIANDPTTERYSFKLEFDHYVDGQTCFGLDKLILNNNYADATNMKEALVYDMFRFLDADASLYNYAKISVNGEYWGVYLALEAVEDSFLLRNYGAQNGALYKPEGVNFGGGNAGGGDFSGFQPDGMDFENAGFDGADFRGGNAADISSEADMPEMPGTPDMADIPDMPDMPDMTEMPNIGVFSSGGADLNYTDDDADSYSTIWDGEVTKTNTADHKRVIQALKSISEGEGLESAMDIDNLLRYMAVHIFSVNEDSLSGTMAHNYYLYESGGRLNLIPWDYNLAFGGMGGGNDASSVVNAAIDDAFSSTTFFDTLMDNAGYHSQYYAYLRRLVDEYIDGGGLDAFYTRVRNQLDALVETDPNAFYSYAAYQTAADTLYQLVQLRGQSIRGQLDGSIPSTEAEQHGSDARIDAASIDLSLLGSMNTGGFDRHGFNTDVNHRDNASDVSNVPALQNSNMQPQPGESERRDQPDAAPAFGGGRGSDATRPNGSASPSESAPALQNLAVYALSLLVLLAALLFAAHFHRPRK